MSRFKPLSNRPPAAPLQEYRPAIAANLAPSVPATNPTRPVPIPVAQEQTSAIDTLGFVFLCIYIVSGFANEFALRLLKGKAYLSIAALLLLPPFWLFSRNRFRGLRHNVGRWWLFFLACLFV